MLNINPMNSYSKSNINFKSQKDYSKIYKEMEKIFVTQEEKIIPKQNKIKNVFPQKNFNISSNMTSPFKRLKNFFEVYKPVILVSGLTLAAIITYLIPSADKKSQHNSNNIELIDNSNKELESIIFEKADLLENMYKKGSISFNDYKSQMQNLINEYEKKAINNFLGENGISLDKEGLGDKENTYFDNGNGTIVVTTNDIAFSEKLTEHITEKNNNVEKLKQKLKNNEEIEHESKKKNDSTISKIENEKEALKIEYKEDSLFNLYKTKEITLEEFQNELNKINER